jgi:hypothetical protein
VSYLPRALGILLVALCLGSVALAEVFFPWAAHPLISTVAFFLLLCLWGVVLKLSRR